MAYEFWFINYAGSEFQYVLGGLIYEGDMSVVSYVTRLETPRQHGLIRLSEEALCFSQPQPLLRVATRFGFSIEQTREHGTKMNPPPQAAGYLWIIIFLSSQQASRNCTLRD